MEGLALAGQSSDIRILLPILMTEPSLALRHQAAIAIVDIAAREPTALSDQSLTWARLASDDDDFALRADAAGVLSEDKSTQAENLLLRLAKTKSQAFEKSAIHALGKRTDAASLAALHDGLSDEAAEVRAEALTALVKLGSLLVQLKQNDLVTQVRNWLEAVLRSQGMREQLLARIGLQRLGDETQRAQLATLYQK